jgi:hypothetical protein
LVQIADKRTELRDGEDEAGPDAAFGGYGDGVVRRIVATPGIAIAGAVVAKGVDAVAGAVDGHAVREREDAAVEMGGGRSRLEATFAAAVPEAAAIAALVAVTLQVDFFEIKRVMVEAGGFPVEGVDRPTAGAGGAGGLGVDFIPTRRCEVAREFAGWFANIDTELVEWLVWHSAAWIFRCSSRTGRRGQFLGCSGYPKCKNTAEVPAKLAEELGLNGSGNGKAEPLPPPAPADTEEAA